jgi:DNA-binding transcriptional LysR family regulator
VVIVPPGHGWARRHAIDIEQLRDAALLGGEPGTGTGRNLRDALAESGVDLAVTRSLGSTEAVKRAVQAGNGVLIVLASAVDQEVRAGVLVALPLSGRPLSKTLYAIHRTSMPDTAPARLFTRLLLGDTGL